MKTSHLFVLFLVGLTGAVLVALFQPVPGYMDAEYYFAGALSLAGGKGFWENFIWNYLSDPAGLPVPSHAYWMPLASILGALGMWMSGGSLSFTAARLGFILLAGIVPPLTASLSYAMTGRRDLAWISGLLAVFSGYYVVYLPTTDTFGLYMALGGSWLLVAASGMKNQTLRFLVLGGLAGLMHLARADGVLWLFLTLVFACYPAWANREKIRSGRALPPGLLPAIGGCLAAGVCGYLLVMGPWMARNWSLFGTLLSPGGTRTLWVTEYNELYLYPASILTPEHWLNAGLAALVRSRLASLGQNLLRALAVQGQIFLAPFILVGLWRLRCDRRAVLGAAAWALTLSAMSLVFPFAGARGGFFHSGAAIQPLFWAVAPLGLEVVVSKAAQLRQWNAREATKVFQFGAIFLALVVTTFLLSQGGMLPGMESKWGEDEALYARLETALTQWGAAPDAVVMVNNPPGYYIVARRPAVVIPYTDAEGVLAAAAKFHAQYLLLEIDQIVDGEEMYEHPADYPGFHYLGSVDQAHVYEIKPTHP